MKKLLLLLFVFLPLLSFAGTAVDVFGLYTTGYSSAWKTSNGSAAYVVSNRQVDRNDWLPNTFSSQWVSYNNGTNIANTTYSYTLTFNIGNSVDLNNLIITLSLVSDDSASILVNGVSTGETHYGWTTSTTHTLSLNNSVLHVETNTLTINVSNSGYGPSGLNVTGISAAVVPETGTWLIACLSTMMVVWLKVKRKVA